MDSNSRPIYGFSQPFNGLETAVTCQAMKGGRTGPKRRKTPGFMRTVLAANVRALLEHQYRSEAHTTARLRSLSKDSGLTLSSIQRVLDSSTGATIDTIEQLATAFGVQVYQLLSPQLDAANPPIIAGATEAEKRLYSSWRRSHLGATTKELQ